MAQNVTIAGASYTGVPYVTVPKTGGGTAKFIDTSDGTASASDIASGKTAYVGGNKVTGTKTSANIQTSKSVTITSNGSTTVTPDSGYDALQSVNIEVDVSEGGSEPKALYIFNNYNKRVVFDGGIGEIEIGAGESTQAMENITAEGLFQDTAVLQVYAGSAIIFGLAPDGNLIINVQENM